MKNVADLIEDVRAKRADAARRYAEVVVAAAAGELLPDDVHEILAAAGTDAELLQGDIAARRLKGPCEKVLKSADAMAPMLKAAKAALLSRDREMEGLGNLTKVMFEATLNAAKKHRAAVEYHHGRLESEIAARRHSVWTVEKELARLREKLADAKGHGRQMAADAITKLAQSPPIVEPVIEPSLEMDSPILTVVATAVVGVLRAMPNDARKTITEAFTAAFFKADGGESTSR